MAMLEVSVVPLGTGDPSVSSYVATALKILESIPGIEYELTPMGTVLTGELELLLDCARRMHQAVLGEEGVRRVVTTIKIDDRSDRELSISEKLAAVHRHL